MSQACAIILTRSSMCRCCGAISSMAPSTLKRFLTPLKPPVSIRLKTRRPVFSGRKYSPRVPMQKWFYERGLDICCCGKNTEALKRPIDWRQPPLSGVRDSDDAWARSWMRFNYQLIGTPLIWRLFKMFYRRGWFGPRWQAAWNAGVETSSAYIDWRHGMSNKYIAVWSFLIGA